MPFFICLLVVIGFFWQNKAVTNWPFLPNGAFTDNSGSDSDVVPGVDAIRLQGRQPERRHVICPGFTGGLGNQLFQFCSSYGIGRKLGLDVLVKPKHDVFQMFDIWAVASLDNKICAKAKRIKEKHGGIYEDNFMALRPDSDYFLVAYLQSWKYFEPYKGEIRKQLRFRGDIEKKAHDILSSVLTTKYGKRNYSSRTLVGVHVRRGDFLDEDKQKYGNIVADTAYIERALAYFIKTYHDVAFLVCSDDMKWSKANVNGSDVIFIERNKREVDLAILSSLNHTIVTVGTFGWWGAWLANGTTVYYKNFLHNGTGLANTFQSDASDYIYPGWIAGPSLNIVEIAAFISGIRCSIPTISS